MPPLLFVYILSIPVRKKVAMYNTEVYNIYGLYFPILWPMKLLFRMDRFFKTHQPEREKPPKKGEKKRNETRKTLVYVQFLLPLAVDIKVKELERLPLFRILAIRSRSKVLFFLLLSAMFCLVSFYFPSVGKMFTQVAVVFIFSVHSQSFWFDYTHAL